MTAPPPGGDGRDDPRDLERLAAAGTALADAVEASVPAWIERLVADRVISFRGEMSASVRAAAAAAGTAARDEVVPRLRNLVGADVDHQTTNPLALLRSASTHAARVLRDAQVPAVERDGFAERTFPDDDYDLVPATWADIDPALTEPGITWSAAKAFVFKARRRREGSA